MQDYPGNNAAAKTMRRVLDACADCDACRFLMDEQCAFFPELYRLWDRKKEKDVPITDDELSRLADLCTLCGLCPCSNIRADIIRSKTERARQQGLALNIRLLADAQQFGRWAGRMPKVINTTLACAPLQRTIKKMMGIHPQRHLPKFPQQSFFAWARQKGLNRPSGSSPKAAYFAGCTAGYFFPQVARAAVSVLKQNNISVFVPCQQCCGMPTLLEGDAHKTLQRVQANLDLLLEAAQDGYDLVCSCPTCGFLMKVLLKDRACYSDRYQRFVKAGADEIKIPAVTDGAERFISLKKSMYHQILTDDGYFSALDPLKRISLSHSMMDLGEYLSRLYHQNRLNTQFGGCQERMAYFTPCHQRELGIGSPYDPLLALIPGLIVERVGGSMDCCGMGGSFGFKQGFYNTSIELSRPLMRKIKAIAPAAIITDCLSCRLQFEHLLPYPVFHPLEILSRAYQTPLTAG